MWWNPGGYGGLDVKSRWDTYIRNFDEKSSAPITWSSKFEVANMDFKRTDRDDVTRVQILGDCGHGRRWWTLGFYCQEASSCTVRCVVHHRLWDVLRSAMVNWFPWHCYVSPRSGVGLVSVYRSLLWSLQESFTILLLPLTLQPTVGFGLSKNVLPFFPISHQVSPSPQSQHLKISFYFLFLSFPGSSPSSRPESITMVLWNKPLVSVCV